MRARGSASLDALPTQIPGNVVTAPFECIVPGSASPSNPARISLYGHGLLGSHTEVEMANVQAMATEHNIVFCATDWWGLAVGDVATDAGALSNLNLFPAVIDRLRQGVLNTHSWEPAAAAERRFAPCGAYLYSNHPDQSLHPLVLDLMQQLWDRGDPDVDLRAVR